MASLAVLRTSVRRLIDETDTSNTHFDDDEIDDYLNQATLFLGSEMEWPIQTSTAPAVTDQALYTLPEDFISLTEGYFDNTPLSIVERDDMKSIALKWQESESGIPRYLYKSDNATFGLYPAPDSSQEALSIQIQYVSCPATLSSDSDIPDVHAAFQICLPFYAAFLCESSSGNDKKAAINMQNYQLHKNALKSRLQRFSDELYRWRWPA